MGIFRSAVRYALGSAAAASLGFVAGAARAADHRDGPSLPISAAADICDVYFFLDPSNNSFAVLAITVKGYIAPAENASSGFFDETIRYRYEIDNSGDARPDVFIEVYHTKQVDPAKPQTATVKFRDGDTTRSFKAATTPSTGKTTPAVPSPVVTTDGASKISFYSGLLDDTFYFDLGAANAYLMSREAGQPKPKLLDRGEDSFAGVNTLGVVLRVPVSLLQGSSNSNVLGLSGVAQRRSVTYTSATDPDEDWTMGDWMSMDRMGVPLINRFLVPYASRDLYNRSDTRDDAALLFQSEIRKRLGKLGTSAENVRAIERLAVTDGDMLRLDTSVANTGRGGGDNAQAGFPNGRRPNDDVADLVLGLISNGDVLDDMVHRNDVPVRNGFPFFAPPHQP